jgi:hypothetical protein
METTIDERARDAATAVRTAAVAAWRPAAAAPWPVLREDTVESLTYLADRAARKVRRRFQSVDDVGVDTAHCIKRHPFTALGFTLAFGLAIGAVIGGFQMKRRLNALLRED